MDRGAKRDTKYCVTVVNNLCGSTGKLKCAFVQYVAGVAQISFRSVKVI
jgi:hypothetical protein